MPVNSFADYPLSWTPKKSELRFPYYVSLAENMERDIQSGALPNGLKLPPQRELADYLDISLSTVTKTYKLCEAKGLIGGRIGSGTYVCAGTARSILERQPSGGIQMGSIYPFYEHNARVAKIAASVLNAWDAASLFSYGEAAMEDRHIEAARKWLLHFGVAAEQKNIIFASGAQNALAIILMSLFSAGDCIAADAYTYANFIGLANMKGIRLLPVAGDEQGMLPQALDSLCKSNTVKGVYLMPSCSNPTNTVMGPARREAIAAVVQKQGLLLIEDDIYSFLLGDLVTPICALAPEQSIYINSLSKSICAGLRVAYIRCPERLFDRLDAGACACNLKGSMLNLEIATQIIASGEHLRLMEDKRKASLARNLCFSQFFPEETPPQNAATYFHWLPLPLGIRGRDMEMLCASARVVVLGSERFSLHDLPDSHFVRIASCSPPDMVSFERGLHILRDIYNGFGSIRRHEMII